MKLHVFDIPDNPALLPTWLEGQLMGLDLHQLVTELSVFHGPAEEPALSLYDVLGGQQLAVLQTGLRALSRLQLRQLLRQPQLLLDMQRLVLDEGGDYWVTLPASEEVARLSQETWRQVQEVLQAQPVVRRHRPWPMLWAGLATAAAVILLALFAYDHWWRSVPAAPTGIFAWSTPQTWPKEGRAAYLTFLADQAETFWFAERPTTHAALAQRLGELRAGCSVLIVQEHAVLDKEDQAWLKGKCQAWALKLDAERQLLETRGDAAVADVRGHVDDIVRNLAKALRARGREQAG